MLQFQGETSKATGANIVLETQMFYVLKPLPRRSRITLPWSHNLQLQIEWIPRGGPRRRRPLTRWRHEIRKFGGKLLTRAAKTGGVGGQWRPLFCSKPEEADDEDDDKAKITRPRFLCYGAARESLLETR